MLALISKEVSRIVVTVDQLVPTSVSRPTTCPWLVTATMPSSRPALVPLPMVKVLFQLEESQEMM